MTTWMDYMLNMREAGSRGLDYQKQLQDMYSEILKGGNPFESPLFKGAMEGIQQSQKMGAAELNRNLTGKGITGGAYSQPMGNLYEQGIKTAGGLGNQLMQQAATGLQGLSSDKFKELNQMYQNAFQAKQAKNMEDLQRDQAMMQGISGGFSGLMSGMGGMGKSGGGGGGGGGCCWTFMAGDMLTDDVRMFRDKHYSKDSYIGKGYKMMSNWLVPLMEKSTLVREIVKAIMLKPMSKFARYYHRKDLKANIYAPIGLFWTTLWDLSARFKIAIS